jgi:TatD DNase family protein
MSWIDSHVHLADSQFRQDIEQVIESAFLAGVQKMVAMALDEAELDFCLALQQKYPQNIFVAAAVHPNDVEEGTSSFMSRLETAPLVAIGETGIDLYRDKPLLPQIASLKNHMRISEKRKLPLIVHLRSKEEDSALSHFFRVVDEEKFSQKVLLHCFGGTRAEAKEAVVRGFMMSFSANITYPKNEMFRDVVGYIPEDRILIETDAPFLAPQGKRGKRNEPAYVVETAKKVAEIRGLSEDELSKILAKNMQNLFGKALL